MTGVTNAHRLAVVHHATAARAAIDVPAALVRHAVEQRRAGRGIVWTRNSEAAGRIRHRPPVDLVQTIGTNAAAPARLALDENDPLDRPELHAQRREAFRAHR